MSPVVRTILFWAMMIALAMVLWQMASRPTNQKPSSAMSYSDFMAQVDKNNVASAKLIESTATAEIQAQFRDSSPKSTVTIPKEVIPDLTERLRKQGAAVDVEQGTDSNKGSATSMIINLSPIVLIVGVWLFMMRQMQKMRNPPQQGGPASGALG